MNDRGPLPTGLEWDVYVLRSAVAGLAAGLAHGADPAVLFENLLITLTLDEEKVQEMRAEAAGLGARRDLAAPAVELRHESIDVGWSPMQHGWYASWRNEDVFASTAAEAVEAMHQLIVASKG